MTVEYAETKKQILQKQSSLDSTKSYCSVCNEVEIVDISMPPTDPRRQNVCSSCQHVTCSNCGDYELNPRTKVIFYMPQLPSLIATQASGYMEVFHFQFQIWVCRLCSQRKRVLLSNQLQSVQQQQKSKVVF